MPKPHAQNFEILPLLARIATPTVPDFDLSEVRASGLVVVIEVTAIAASPLLTVTIQGVDPVSGTTYDVLVSAVISTASSVILRVHPALTAAANLVADDIVPPTLRVIAAHGDADSITYSIAGAVTD